MTIRNYQTQILEDLEYIEQMVLLVKTTMLKIGHSVKFVDDFSEFLMIGVPSEIFIDFIVKYCKDNMYHGYTEISLCDLILDMVEEYGL
jgi:hypothetical protein